MTNLWKRARSVAMAVAPVGLLLLPTCQPEDITMFVEDFARQVLAAYLF